MKSDKIVLNAEQKKAVEDTKGPLLIIAGAGTGKTTVISEKIRYLIKKKKVKPQEILALTFTEKAANEMEERADQILPYGYFQMWISTFHSFADQVLREEISHIGLSPSYKLMNNAETILFLRNNLFLFNLKYFRPLGNPNKFLEALLQHFSRLRDENISTEEYLNWSSHSVGDKEEREKNQELARAYELYQKLKIKEGRFDFSDLIYYLIQLFKKRKNILGKYRSQFKYVLVDEFQDTNIAQYDLLKLLCPPKEGSNLTVVGDDSQAIYKFRGASVSNILAFMKDYKNSKQITLKKNYRSYQNMLDSSFHLIKHNDPDTLEVQLGISKKLTSAKAGVGDIDFYLANRVEQEANYVAIEILKLKKIYKNSDFAILVRANNHADPFIRALTQRGIPYQFLGPSVLFKQPEVKDLIAYLNSLSDIDDSVSLYRVLNMDILDIDKRDLAALIAFSKRTSQTLFNALEILIAADPGLYKKYLPLLSKKTKEKLAGIYKMILRHLKAAKRDTAGQILYYFLEDTGYLQRLTSYQTAQDEKIALNVSKFFDKLKSYEIDHEDASAGAVCDFLKMSMELGESPLSQQDFASEYDAVNILTVHSAKGLEWPVVFLVNLSQGRFPTYQRRETIPIPQELIKEKLPTGDYHLLEERRLFYVALTRAMDKVFLTSSHFYQEGKRERRLSNFVVETLGENLLDKKLTFTSIEEQSSILEFKKKEESLVRKEDLPKVFSFSQLETYILCPLKYKYQYVLRIPTIPGAAASFGETIHKTLQVFYQEFLQGAKVSEKRLLEIYKDLWIPIGYASSSHETRMNKEGVKMLSDFFKKFHHPRHKILDLEKPFKIRIDNDILISGKIDRVDRTNGELEIIDYKTGKKPNEKDLKNSLQLSIYLLAASAKGIYDYPVDKINLTFYYLQNMEAVSMKKTAEDIMETKDKVKEIVDKIREGSFDPRVGPHCDFCAFRMICEAWQ